MTYYEKIFLLLYKIRICFFYLLKKSSKNYLLSNNMPLGMYFFWTIICYIHITYRIVSFHFDKFLDIFFIMVQFMFLLLLITLFSGTKIGQLQFVLIYQNIIDHKF